MMIFGRHVSEATLADLADGVTAAAQLSSWDRRHLETCDRCQSLLEGHRRAGLLLAADWKMIPLREAALAAGAPMRVAQRVGAGQLIGGHQANRLLQLLSGVVAVGLLAVVGLVLWNGSGLLVGGPRETPSPSPAAASWTTFVSARHGYTIDYPPDWSVEAATDPWPYGTGVAGGPGNEAARDTFSGQGTGPGMVATSQLLPSGMAESEWIEWYRALWGKTSPEFCMPAPDQWDHLTVDGIDVGTYVGCGYVEAMAFAGGRVYTFSLERPDSASRQIYDQMLQTVRFDPTAAKLGWPFRPEHVAVDPLGRIYTTDCSRGTVFRVGDRDGAVVIAGSGHSGGFSGDGGPAIEARLECPYGLAFDVAGNLYVADTGNNRVRMIDASGVITTVAGSGPHGWGVLSFEGDGGPATEARLSAPAGVAFDSNGNLYISDMRNRRIRMVDADGIITTIAGDGTNYPNPSFGGDGGPAIEATLNDPQGIAVDGEGNVFFVDTHNNRLRMIDRDGIITTVAGTGELASYGDEGPAVDAALAAPRAVLIDDEGNIYVSEAVWDVILSEPAVPAGVGNRVRRIDTDGIIHAFAGTGEVGFAGDGGPAIEAQLNGSNQNFGLAIDSAGNVYIADSKNQRIRMVDRAGIITTFADGSL